jgi:predicted O-linked N-acetylglucosamine transferase (SPINDLY family)
MRGSLEKLTWRWIRFLATACHTLWMGVPVVTRTGTSAVSRATGSLLHTVGLPEWVARDEADYLRIAAEWAGDLPRLAELRAVLRGKVQASPLMDAPRFARNVEAACRAMWKRWCGGPRSWP